MIAGMRKLSAPALIALGLLGLACTSDPGTGGGEAGSGAGRGGTAGSSSGSAGSSSGAGGGGTAGSSGSTSGGSGGNAGSGGAAGGSAGSAGSSGSGGIGGMVTMSPGCGTPAAIASDEWVPQPALNIEGVDRSWWVWLPTNYDEARAYPIVFLFHGCGSSDNNVPMQNVTGEDAILVRGAAAGECWEYGGDGPDVAFFDEMLSTVLSNHCADASRVFAAGYSSGSWLINTLECRRGDKIRAAGSVAGGTVNPGDCVGQVARIFVHDLDDNDNDISGSETERDRLLEVNHCDAQVDPVPEEPAPCARYQGCDPGFPVIWCATSGQGHDRQDDLAPGAFWALFSEL